VDDSAEQAYRSGSGATNENLDNWQGGQMISFAKLGRWILLTLLVPVVVLEFAKEISRQERVLR
jgi:hypothetical protein